MGKRKYVGDEKKSLKKSKKEESSLETENESSHSEQPESQTASKNVQNPPRIQHGFDVKHFRKELAAKQGQTMVLTQFLQVCLNPDSEVDHLLEYLKSGGNSHEILRQISQENKKNLSLATPAFHLFHLIILKVQSSLPHMISVTEEACRYFLNTFMSTVEIMISESSGPRHRKIILKLLTSMVTLNPDIGIEVLNQVPLTPKHLQYIVEKSNYKEKDNVRTAFVHFMTSFLIDGHLPLIKALLEKQGLLALVIPGLGQDEADAVLMFLNILKKSVVDNNFISKSLKLKTFSHQVLHNLFKVFSWKGPPQLSSDAKAIARPAIMSLLSDILITLFTSHRLGLYFIDSSLGTTDANKNQNLYKAMLTLKRPWENEHECETILHIIYKCPDLHRAIINVIEQSFEPQHSPIWERATAFVFKLFDKLKPEDMVTRMKNLSSSQVANFIRFVTLPVPLLKFITLTLGKDHTISLYCVKVLVKMMQALRRYMQLLSMEDAEHIIELKNRLEYFIPKHLPSTSGIVALIQDVISITDKHIEPSQDFRLPEIKNIDSLISLTDLLLLYNDVHPALFETLEGGVDMKSLLDYSANISEGPVSVLKFKIVSLWLTLDSNAISLKNPMFKELFLIMLEVYTDVGDDDTWVEAKTTLYKFFKNTLIFEVDEHEIDCMLYALRNPTHPPPVTMIGDIVEYVLQNIKELTEYLRKQIVNFEIYNESSEANLHKLFDNLMENKNTADSVFLENKVPSPFIIGCMRYVEKNKETRKILEDFLTLYLMNLLHNNCSPELTELLIGDTKLKIRDYVGAWASQPRVFPLEDNKATLPMRQISMAILKNTDIPITDILPCLEEATEEESDFSMGDIHYKIVVHQNTDSTDLLIWAKYLIFVCVRLTNMKLLNEEKQTKISQYFQCILEIAKKHHMVDVCRTIMIALFKNPHVLKIYSLVDLGKDECSILATKFLIDVITKNEDIINYLEKKYKLLKSYQQKNYSEIVKIFVKIHKRKNASSGHASKILETVGLAREDDLRVFNEVFGADLNACVKDDKEPSVILEILRVLIDKYGKTITMEPQPGVLKKTMKLYTELLTNKDITPNLTNLENSLTKFFENNPHHIGAVTDEMFKQFFDANAIRKSTSQLASTILKLNPKLCKIFKEQIARPEILSQRELTLPLGNAILKHSQFLTDNKDFLTTIYSEYKSNIGKLLEKPHKAGQIYITCWEFVKKLILECMEPEVCEKLFAKSHKFEVVELSHVHLIQAAILKLTVVNQMQRKDHLLNYYLTMINLITMAIKEAKETDIVKAIIANVYNITQVSKQLKGFENENTEGFKKFIESAIWQSFCKAVLKDSLKIRTAVQGTTCGPQLLHLLSTLVKIIYPEDHKDTATLFEMVTSHSEFLNVMLSYYSSDIKSRLVEFIFVLISKNKSLMKSQQIPVYLSAYHATRSPCDRMLLAILHYYESNELPVNEYKPYVFGDSAANHYAVRKNRTSSLWAHPTPNQVLNLFEKDTIERTVTNFPVTQKLDYNYELPSNIDEVTGQFIFNKMTKDGLFRPHQIKDNEGAIANFTLKVKYQEEITLLKTTDLINVSHVEGAEGIYDPVFLFPLLSHLLAPGSVASGFKLLRSGLLAMPVMALGSHCPLMRAAAYHVLHRFHLLLETETRHKNDKLFLTDFIATLRQSLATAITQNGALSDGIRNPRLPAVGALYLAKALMVSTAPFDPLYKPVNNFFIAKQLVDLTVVPDFLSLFHDSDVEAAERRAWILDVIKYGTKTMTDVNVLFKTMCLKMMMDFCNSVLCDRRMQEKIVSALSSIASIPRACEILIEGYALISWLHSFVRQLKKEDRSSVKSILCLIENVLKSMTINAFAKNLNTVERNGKPIEFSELKVNKEVEGEVLLILYDLLHQVEYLEFDEVTTYVKTYSLLSRKVVKLLSKKQLLNFVNKIGEIMKDTEGVKIIKKAVLKSDVSMLRSKSVEAQDGVLADLCVLVKTNLSN